MNGKFKFLIIAILYAVAAVGLWNFSLGWHQVAALFIAGAIFALGIGLPLGVIRYVGDQNYMLTGCGCATFLFYLIVGPAVLLATTIAFAQTGWVQGKWEPLPSAPEPFVSMPLGRTSEGNPGTRQEFYVSGVSGAYYAYECDYARGCAWRTVATLPNAEVVDPYCFGDTSRDIAPPPKGRVLGESIILVCGPDGYVQTNYQLIDNGSVWRWEKRALPDFGFAFAGLILAGIVIGTAVSIYVNRLYWDDVPRPVRLRHGGTIP